jgi:thioredoxin-like negative regulator of GroEL
LIFYIFYSNSKKLKPIYSEAADLLKSQGLSATLAHVDCGSASTLCSKFQVSGYPSIKYFKNGKFVSDYNKERTTEAIIEYFKSNSAKDEL